MVPRAGLAPSSSDVNFGASVKWARHSEELDSVEVEKLMIQAVNMQLASEKFDQQAKREPTWLWEEPELVS